MTSPQQRPRRAYVGTRQELGPEQAPGADSDQPTRPPPPAPSPQAAAVPLGPRTIDEALALALSAINDVSIVADNILAGLFLRMRREVADAHDRGYDEGYQDAIERAATRLSEHPAARRAVLDLAGRTDS